MLFMCNITNLVVDPAIEECPRDSGHRDSCSRGGVGGLDRVIIREYSSVLGHYVKEVDSTDLNSFAEVLVCCTGKLHNFIELINCKCTHDTKLLSTISQLQ